MSQIVDFRIDGRVGQSAQQRYRAFQLRIPPSIALREVQRGVEMFARGRKPHALMRKDARFSKRACVVSNDSPDKTCGALKATALPNMGS